MSQTTDAGAALAARLAQTLDEIRGGGLYKPERVLASAQQPRVAVPQGRVLNFCANNYLGLANHPALIEAAHRALDDWGFGMASVRFICGTQQIHKRLEERLSAFLGTADTILYNSCFDANGGLFETLLSEEDTVISDELNHASIIDGIRLCKARRRRYRNSDMADLEAQLQAAAADSRTMLIVTDGVFSMDGHIAKLADIRALADRHGALLMVDDSHAVGFIGEQGRGTHELHGLLGRVDILTGTLGKALGGACGGYTSGRRELIELLRQRSRPYLFSNSLPPPVVGAALAALDLVEAQPALRRTLQDNTLYCRALFAAQGFDVLPGEHAIVPVMLGDAGSAARLAERLLEKGIYVTAFSYPVVPRGRARIRVQVSAAHTRADIEEMTSKFAAARRELGL
jgi:glycine C-acetyltransferase